MKQVILLFCSFQMFFLNIQAQKPADFTAAAHWADSVMNTLSQEEQIAQLMIVRLSGMDANRKPVYYDSLVKAWITQYNIGGVCIFQGTPVKLAGILNDLQSVAKTPLMVSMDAEWGLGMRLPDSVQPLPRQMMLGALPDSSVVYAYGRLIAEQCKRMGIHVNYAPVVDINNNPNNPVINDRSFGEQREKVANWGIQVMKGMQDAGIMACAKHFPGHGDVSVDSHLDLPVISKSRNDLDSLELYPFQKMFQTGVASVMIAHLYIPAIDSTPNRATSLSARAIRHLMREQLHYEGLTFTDALEMKGVKKYYPDGQASVESLIAGNDMLCLPGDVPASINAIQQAIDSNRLSWEDIREHCRRVLIHKYLYKIPFQKPVATAQLTADLNKGIAALRKTISERALTVLRCSSDRLPSADTHSAYIGLGVNTRNPFAERLSKDWNADVFLVPSKISSDSAQLMIQNIRSGNYNRLIIGIHGFKRTPADTFGISSELRVIWKQLQDSLPAITFIFGNPYAAKYFEGASAMVISYEDDAITQQAAADWLQQKFMAEGRLPVTVSSQYAAGTGITAPPVHSLPVRPAPVGFNGSVLGEMDSVITTAMQRGATPGAVILVVKDGQIVYQRAFGKTRYLNGIPMTCDQVFDMASITKVSATTLAIMKLYEQGKIQLDSSIGYYLPFTRNSDKAGITLRQLLLHEGGLIPFVPFVNELVLPDGSRDSIHFRNSAQPGFSSRVAENCWLADSWKDTLWKQILQSPLSQKGKYVYSDNDFIFLAKIVESVSGRPLDEYVSKWFYQPMGLTATGFRPYQFLPRNKIVPTEQESGFRNQLLWGDVHDPGAALFGGVAGHAGLFSTARETGMIFQMLLDGGLFNGRRYLKHETIELFTRYSSTSSRRGLGFDKPEKNNSERAEPYPCGRISSSAFGHTGFTGTCVWADPQSKLIYVFLSNRVHPDGGNNGKLSQMNIRSSIHDIIYRSILHP